jgi:hypothetical protein
VKISDAAVGLLNKYATRALARKIDSEDQWIYAKGLEDGQTLLAQDILGELKPDVEVPAELESE